MNSTSGTPGSRPVVCVQGLGFVGMAMTLATATARRLDGSPVFGVIGREPDNQAVRTGVGAAEGTSRA